MYITRALSGLFLSVGDMVSESYSSIQIVGIQPVSLSDDEGHQRLLVVDEEDRFTKSGNSNFLKDIFYYKLVPGRILISLNDINH